MLKMQPNVRALAEPLTSAMVEVYHESQVSCRRSVSSLAQEVALIRPNVQEHLTSDMQPHYVYSPRELTRWVRGIAEVRKERNM